MLSNSWWEFFKFFFPLTLYKYSWNLYTRLSSSFIHWAPFNQQLQRNLMDSHFTYDFYYFHGDCCLFPFQTYLWAINSHKIALYYLLISKKAIQSNTLRKKSAQRYWRSCLLFEASIGFSRWLLSFKKNLSAKGQIFCREDYFSNAYIVWWDLFGRIFNQCYM